MAKSRKLGMGLCCCEKALNLDRLMLSVSPRGYKKAAMIGNARGTRTRKQAKSGL